MSLLAFVLPGVASAVLAGLLTPAVRRLAIRLGAVDQPGGRKVHTSPTPRLGGLAVIAAAVVVLGALGIWTSLLRRESLWLGLSLGVLPIVFVSVWDDVRGLTARWKFLGHLVGAAVAVALGVSLGSEIHLFGHTLPIGAWAVPISMLWLIGVTNAFNLVDGLDGLSAGLALISAGSLVAVFVIAHQTPAAVAALVLAGAIVGFLPHNVHPARVFLGDTGATAIGFALACLALRGGSTFSAGFATLLPLIVLGVPVADTLISMLRRALHAATVRDSGRMFEADRGHLHHRLLDLGFGHGRAVLALHAAGLCFALVGLASIFMTMQEAGLLLLGLLAAGFVALGRLGYEEFGAIRSGRVLRVYDAPVLKSSVFIVFIDLAFVAFSAYAAIVFRTEDWGLAFHREAMVSMAALLAPCTVVVLWLSGVYSGTWRMASVLDVLRHVRAVGVASLVGFLLARVVLPYDLPLLLFVLFALVKTAVGLGARLSYRLLVFLGRRARAAGQRTLIYGAGQGGAAALREMLSNPAVGMRPVGFIDDEPGRAGKALNGVRIVGSLSELEQAIRSLQAEAVVVSTPKVPPEKVAAARAACERAGAKLVKMEIRFDEYPGPGQAQLQAGVQAQVRVQARAPVHATAQAHLRAPAGPPQFQPRLESLSELADPQSEPQSHSAARR